MHQIGAILKPTPAAVVDLEADREYCSASREGKV
jgi:hypothetical protein